MKKIGILTYHSVCNYGANLQTFSTVGYFRKKGFIPIVIDWVPYELERQYLDSIPPAQYDAHRQFVKNYLPLSERCISENDVLEQIRKHSLDGVIIGSDAVTQHKSLWARFHFPTKEIFSISPLPPPQLMYPNPFWGCFVDKISPRIPTVMMSVSCQNERYHGILGSTRKQMCETLRKMSYISVRDGWTQKMFKYISRGSIVPPVTPDPVFSFNENVGEFIDGQQSLFKKFSISSRYILLSFVDEISVDRDWVAEFVNVAKSNNIECYMLPMPKGHIFKDIPDAKYIQQPISPLEWYGLIKYSMAYVGHNMHPMIVAIHNNVPFFVFDYYGVVLMRLFLISQSSKIYDLLQKAKLLKQRAHDLKRLCRPPKPSEVFRSLLAIQDDRSPLIDFNASISREYKNMMENIVAALSKCL